MTPAALRKLALSLPGASEAPHFERTSFRVGKKIFATMTRDGKEAMVKVAPQEKVEALLAAEPKVYFSYGAWTLKGALGVHLQHAELGPMRALVTAAHAAIVPKKKSKRS